MARLGRGGFSANRNIGGGAIFGKDGLIAELRIWLAKRIQVRRDLKTSTAATPLLQAPDDLSRRVIAHQMAITDAQARIAELEDAVEARESELRTLKYTFVQKMASLSSVDLGIEKSKRISFGIISKRFRRINYRKIVSKSPLFDEEWYTTQVQDLESGADPVLHYLANKNIYSPSAYFDSRSYLEANPDVASGGFDALIHFLAFGHKERRPLERRFDPNVGSVEQIEKLSRSKVELSLAVPFAYRANGIGGKVISDTPVAVLAHIFYEDCAPEVYRYLCNIPGPVDVFISTTDTLKEKVISETFSAWKAGFVEVRVVANRGRDIAPTIVDFRDVYDRYEIILHVHGKKSPHSNGLVLWRTYLLETLVGDRDTVESILDGFRHNRNLGMIGAAHFAPVRRAASWGANFQQASELANGMGFSLKESGRIDFPSGSMFWMRSAALRPLMELDIQTDDFEIEDGQTDGTLAHAIERLLFFCCERAQFIWAKISRPEFLASSVSALNVANPEYINTFYETYRLRLIESSRNQTEPQSAD